VAIYLDELATRTSVSRNATELTRGEFFAALFTLGCLSGLASRVIQSGRQDGWVAALFNSFEISIIVWISCACGIALVLRDRTTGIRSSEFAIGAGIVFLVLLPIGPLSWVAVAALSLYILTCGSAGTSRRGAFILLATTVPMLWSRLLFHFFARQILQIDASLVGWILGTPRNGDIVGFADGSGFLVILPGCSSLANMSLAFLCWVTVSQMVRHKRSIHDWFWCLMACISVITVNVTRISFMGLSQHHYAMFHSPWGDAVSNTTIFILIVGFSILGVRRELFPRI
jgi:exosortase/archaeosortase family protein